MRCCPDEAGVKLWCPQVPRVHHPDRDTQFRYSGTEAGARRWSHPILKLDTQKKAFLGDCKIPGPVWCKRSIEVHVHDCPGNAFGRAVPYGLYELPCHQGIVDLGTAADTPEFAVTGSMQWCEYRGTPARMQDCSQRLGLRRGTFHQEACHPLRWLEVGPEAALGPGA